MMPDANDPQASLPREDLKREYLAFISYRHLDNQQYGRQWATWLHQSIETYEVPEDLIGAENDVGQAIPEVLYPIFRDEEELAADANLAESLIAALERSRYLIVLCSPRSVASQYVCEEISYFKRMGGSKQILSVIIEGEPSASSDSSNHVRFTPDQECLPLPLRHPVDENGNIDTTRPEEPIAADFRLMPGGRQGWTTPAAYREALQAEKKHTSQEIKKQIAAYSQKLELGLCKILAALMGVPLGELTRRDKAYQLHKARQKTRLLRRWLAATTILAAIAIGSSLMAWHQRGIAIENEGVAKANEKTAIEKEGERRKEAQRANAEAATARRQELVARMRLYAREFDGARRSWEQGDLELAQEYLDRCPWDLRGWEHDYLSSQVRQALRKSKRTEEPNLSDVVNAALAPVEADPPQYGSQLLEGHSGQVTDLVFSNDGQRLATGCSDGIIGVWDMQSRKQEQTISGYKGGRLQFSPDGAWIAGPGTEADVVVWDASTGAMLAAMNGHTGAVEDLAFSSDGCRIASASVDGTVRIWDASSGRALHVLRRHTRQVHAIVWSPTGRIIVSAGVNNEIFVWDGNSGKQIGELRGHLGRKIRGLAFSPDGATLASVNNAETVKIWKTDEAGRWVVKRSFTGSGLWEGAQISFGRDDSRLFSAGEDGKIHILNVVSGERVFSLTGGRPFATSADGRWVATGGNTPQLWDADNRLRLFSVRREKRIPRPVTSVAFSPRGDRFLVVQNSSAIDVWDSQTGELVHTLIGHRGNVWDARFSTDGEYVVSGGRDGIVRLWNVDSGQELLALNGQKDGIACVSSASGMQRIVSGGSHGKINIWSTKDEVVLCTIHAEEGIVRCVDISPDLTRVISCGSDNYVKVWDARNGRLVQKLAGHSAQVSTVAYSPDGKCILSAGADHTLRVWSATTGEELRVLTEHTDVVSSAAFSRPDGAIIASTSRDGTARLWDVSTGRSIEVLEDSGKYIAPSPGARQILTSGREALSKDVHVWLRKTDTTGARSGH